MKVALVGFGIENQSAYRYWKAKGADITVCDQDTTIEVPKDTHAQLGEEYLNGLDKFDIIVRSVGIHPRVITDYNPRVAKKITTAVSSFFDECKTPILGITGTKGKGTTSTLAYKILQNAGKKTVLAGNIGVPMLDILEESASCDIVVLELSSFQLYDLQTSPHIAVCLMVVPEHLNWHTDMDDYTHAKANIFRYQHEHDFAVFNAGNENSRIISDVSPASKKLSYSVPRIDQKPETAEVQVDGDDILVMGQAIMKTSDVKLLGRHNLENVCAAIAATWDLIDGNIDAIRSAVTEFSGLEHRLELVRDLNQVRYYNDSFATTPETAIAAIQSFTEPKVLIIGGSDKGVTFEKLTDAIVQAGNVRYVLTIGQTGPQIAQQLRERGFQNIVEDNLTTMTKIVATTQEKAQPGDIVLLSTGCASFGMFKDYKDRGIQFKQAVNLL